MSELPVFATAYLDRVQCAGDEEELLACSSSEIGDTSCNTHEGAGVRCECM